jgi:hypothetical protein
MNISLRQSLLPATALAVLANFALPALRADEPAAPTIGALTDPGAPGLAAATSDTAQPAAGKKKGGKKKNGKKKHGKKAKDAATSADQAITTAAPATPADAAK